MGKYREPARPTDFKAFRDIVESRRSVRVFTDEPVPEAVVNQILDLALLAPNSSNLQPWEFVWVRSKSTRAALAKACLDQQAARTAQVLLVCIARPGSWKENRDRMLAHFAQDASTPKIQWDYYRKMVPLFYRVGPFGLFGWIKRALFEVIGWARPIPRGPYTYAGLREWAVKTTALGCENLMLGFRAAGFDSCPMEGFDERRVKRLLRLPRGSHVVMVMGAGRRAETGVYGPRFRFPRHHFIREI